MVVASPENDAELILKKLAPRISTSRTCGCGQQHDRMFYVVVVIVDDHGLEKMG